MTASQWRTLMAKPTTRITMAERAEVLRGAKEAGIKLGPIQSRIMLQYEKKSPPTK